MSFRNIYIFLLLVICSCLDEKNPVSVTDDELPRGYIHLITDQTEYEYWDKISVTIVNLTDTSAIIKMKDSRPTYTLEKYQGEEWKIHHQRDNRRPLHLDV